METEEDTCSRGITRRTASLALFAGPAIANVLGAPTGTLIGQ